MNNPSSRSSQEPVYTKTHMMRSKSPQFDPINARMSNERPAVVPPEKAVEDKLEIKADVMVSFRNISEPEPVLPARSKVISQKKELKVDPSVSKRSSGGNQANGFSKVKNGVVFNSDISGVKIRSPSVISAEKPNFHTAEIAPPRPHNKNTFDLPITKNDPKKAVPNSSESQEKKSPTPATPDAPARVTESQLAPRTPPKRSLSEKIHPHQRGSKSASLLDNPKALIRLLTTQSKFLPDFDKPRVILKQYKEINSFAVTTHRGVVRNYNEDRVSVLLNVQQCLSADESQPQVPKNYSLFSVFDGHGGYGCCNFLKDHLHTKLLENFDFSETDFDSLGNLYKTLDYQYMKSAIDGKHKFSGSCALSIVIGPKFGLAINVGDSRAFCSRKHGALIEDITSDHKPEAIGEFTRVIKNKGELYRMSANQRTGEERYYFVRTMTELEKINEFEAKNPHIIFGPWRVKPGGLSVSRTFGDVESKITSMGGINGTVVCTPETTVFNYSEIDFVLIGCDGIFDRLTNEKVAETIWETIEFYRDQYTQDKSRYEFILGECVNNVLRRAMFSKSEDNLTVILLCFRHFYS